MSIIEEEEEEQQQLKQCRICFDDDNSNELISPCLCRGSSLYVHRKCLDDWRSQNANGRGFKYCTVCLFEYAIETVISNPQEERKRLLKYYLFVTRDILLINLIIQLVLIGLTFLLKIVDTNGYFIRNLLPNSINGILAYYLSALILALAILGLVAFLIICCYLFANNRNNDNTSTNRSSSNRNNNNNNNNNNNGGTNTNSSNGRLPVIGIVVLVFAVIGIFVGLIGSFIILRKIIKHHKEKLWLRQEAEKYIVKDFQGRRNEIENITI
jgi:hypothetical protein